MSHRPDPVDALHAALLTHPLKISGAAKVIARSAGTLYNKFSDDVPGNELTAREALALSDAIESTAYAEAVAAYFGGIFIKIPGGMAGDDDLFEDYLGIIKEMGELSEAFIKAKEDGEIDRPEFDRLTREGYDVIAAIQRFLKDMETRVVEKSAAPVALPRIAMRLSCQRLAFATTARPHSPRACASAIASVATITPPARLPRRAVVKDKLDRLYRRIRARTSPHAVVRCGAGRFDLVPADSPRLDALLRSPEWSARVVGVFTPAVSYPAFCAAVLA